MASHAALSEFIQRENSSPTKTIPEAPGAYGIGSHSDAARIDAYEAAPTLATQPSPEMDMAPQHTLGDYYPDLSLDIQPVVRI